MRVDKSNTEQKAMAVDQATDETRLIARWRVHALFINCLSSYPGSISILLEEEEEESK